MGLSRSAALLTALALAGACQRADGNARADGEDAAASDMQTAAAPDLERGRYLASIMDCAGCHNIGSFSPKPQDGYLEGGTVGFEVPGLGVFYPPNLTPHPEAGLGKWSEAEVIAAVRQGRRPDGRMLAPAMPWHAYSALNDADAKALAAYLKSLPPSGNRVPGPATKENAPRPYLTVAPPAKPS